MPTSAKTRPNDEFGPRPSAPATSTCTADHPGPFAWQDGRRLWILDGEPSNWILAELIFEPRTCRYFEVRRAQYRWPREAAGALLGRTFAGGQRRAEDAARGLIDWVSRLDSGR